MNALFPILKFIGEVVWFLICLLWVIAGTVAMGMVFGGAF